MRDKLIEMLRSPDYSNRLIALDVIESHKRKMASVIYKTFRMAADGSRFNGGAYGDYWVFKRLDRDEIEIVHSRIYLSEQLQRRIRNTYITLETLSSETEQSQLIEWARAFYKSSL